MEGTDGIYLKKNDVSLYFKTADNLIVLHFNIKYKVEVVPLRTYIA